MARALVIVLAAALVGLATYNSFHGGAQRGARSTQLVVDFAYSPNQQQLLVPLIQEFNNEHHAVGGATAFVMGESRASGDVEASVANGTYRPTIWAPASSLWGRLLNYQADAAWVPAENASIVRTPLVIALWKPEAEALGWPRRPIGFDRILALATSRRGWAAYGLPTFGRFKLGHTNPDFSTSGLSFVAAQYYTATGKREGLTVADVRRPAVRAKVHEIQQSIVHYGDTSQFFLDQLRLHGPGYVSALAMEEVSLLDYDRTRPRGSMPLVAVYPAEGTFYFDNPMIILRGPWVTRCSDTGGEGVRALAAAAIDAEPRRSLRLPARRSAAASGRTDRPRALRRSRTAPHRPRPARAARARGDQDGLARRPQGGQRRGRRRYVRLDAGRGQARAGSARAAGVPPAVLRPRPGRADDVLAEHPDDRPAGRDEDEPDGAPGGCGRADGGRGHRCLRRDGAGGRPDHRPARLDPDQCGRRADRR